MKHIIIAIAVLAAALSPVMADVLYLNEGEEHIGKLQSIADNRVIFTTLKNEQKEFEVASIAHILLSRIRKGDEVSNVASITDPVAAGIMSNLPDSSMFRDANYATLYRLNEYEYISENEIFMRTREIVHILKEPGLDQANQAIYYYTDRESYELEYAHTYSPYGKIYHVTDDAISDESIMASTPEYDRIRKMKMALKKVDVGSVIDFSYTKRLTKIDELQPHIISQVFGEREPILHEEIAITFPEKMLLNKHLSQWSEHEAPKFIEKAENGKRIWKWIYSNPKGFIPEQNMLPTSRIFPRLVVYQPYDWKNISSRLSSAYQAARPSEQTLVELLKKAGIDDKTRPMDAVNRIYDLLNREVRDVDMSITLMGSFAPVNSDITMRKKYGNLHSMLTLMHYALQKLGIESYPGFCSGNREKVTIREHASLGHTDYALLKVIIDGKSFYTDGGTPYRPFGTVSSWLQGAIAGFHNEKSSSFFFEELPKQTYEWNRFDRTVLARIKTDGSMEVREVMNYRGPYETRVRELKSLKDQEKSNYAERRVKRVHPRAVLKSFGLTELNDMNAPVAMTIEYDIPEAVQIASDKLMTFTNYWVTYNSSSASLERRNYPMQYWACEENQQTIIFELPEGFDWVTWNRQYQHRSGRLNFFSNMNQSGRNLIYNDRFVNTIDEFVTDAEYQNFRQCMLTMSDLANQWIIIEKKEKTATANEVASETSEISSPVEDSNEKKTE